jgi:murein DD-endopeptidase MepM/ murein hydrolase activator NlpD
MWRPVITAMRAGSRAERQRITILIVAMLFSVGRGSWLKLRNVASPTDNVSSCAVAYARRWCVAFVVLLVPTSCNRDPVLSGYRSAMGVTGEFRKAGHTGVDFRGTLGAPVLASADGVVANVGQDRISGKCILLRHTCQSCTIETFYTSYCHLDSVLLQKGRIVLRGERIGTVGATGSGAAGITHVHVTLCTYPCITGTAQGDFQGTLNPLSYSQGCYSTGRTYELLRVPVLTYPVECP